MIKVEGKCSFLHTCKKYRREVSSMSERRKKNRKTHTNFKRILYATDFSDMSYEAFDTARDMAKRYNATLTIVHVIDTSTEAAGFYLPHITMDNFTGDMKTAAEEMLTKQFKRRLKTLKGYELISVLGTPDEEILKLAKKKNSDLIVLGTYGRSGLDRLLFGSTTERVLRKAGRPVLAVPPA